MYLISSCRISCCQFARISVEVCTIRMRMTDPIFALSWSSQVPPRERTAQPDRYAKDTKDRNYPPRIAPRRPIAERLPTIRQRSCKVYAKHTNRFRNIVQILLTDIQILNVKAPFELVIQFVWIQIPPGSHRSTSIDTILI